MARIRRLARAPIQEAVIDIRFAPVRDADIAAIASEFAPDGIETSFDVWQGMFEVQMTAQEGPQPMVKKAGTVGKRIDFPDSKQILQLRQNGFTFSQLEPYQTWEDMRDAALPLWERFANRIEPSHITRVALRYINAFSLALPIENFDDYLVWAPLVPEGVGDGVAGFLTRVVIPKGEDMGTITQSIEGVVEGATKIKILLDIDIAHACELPRHDLRTLTSTLERLRHFKNSAFFSYLTETTLEMFE